MQLCISRRSLKFEFAIISDGKKGPWTTFCVGTYKYKMMKKKQLAPTGMAMCEKIKAKPATVESEETVDLFMNFMAGNL